MKPLGAAALSAVAIGCVFAGLGGWAPAAIAGGTPENALVIIDPTNADSLYVGNYYVDARGIPPQNVLYFTPGAANYLEFTEKNLDALLGEIANRALEDHIDYVILTPGAPFYVPASGYVTGDPCPAAITRFAISTAYYMAHMPDEILEGAPYNRRNMYYTTSGARAFDSEVYYRYGSPDVPPVGKRFFLSSLLGYIGTEGNTVEETLAMIDLSVAADGTRPEGTFYFMNNTSDPARNVRSPQFGMAVSAIQGLGGQAQVIVGVLPVGHHDCLGILTGAASPDIEGADMTILPGAFCDHLTSYAGTLDSGSQKKVSSWIRTGASGSFGTVQEPCNHPEKFPHAILHAYCYEGLSIGEALFRTVQWLPFQGLMYGDPLTRAHAHLPVVSVPDAPAGVVGGVITLTPAASTTHPTADIDYFEILIDGVRYDTTTPGHTFSVDTRALSDGWHDVRVLAYDDTLVKSVGRWLGNLDVDNLGRAVGLDATPLFGDLATPFEFDLTPVGDDVVELRLIQNGRVVAATTESPASLVVHGRMLGSGPATVQAEALYATGRAVRSAPLTIDVSTGAGAPVGDPPIAYGFSRRVRNDMPFVIELPATIDDAIALTYDIVTPPAQAEVVPATGPYRLMRPAPGATGPDAFTFRVLSDAGDSDEVTVSLKYAWQLGDLNCDGEVDLSDINPFVLAMLGADTYYAAFPGCDWLNADINGDGSVDLKDINPFVLLLAGG